MANFRRHAAVGAGIGFALTAIANALQQQKRKESDPNYKFDWPEFFLKSFAGVGIGAFCGVLPDILEPASSPHHRKFFHSITTATAIGVGMYRASKSNLSKNDKELVNLAGVCYLSHLVLDSETKFGLPLVA